MPKRVVDFVHTHPGSGRVHTHFKGDVVGTDPTVVPGLDPTAAGTAELFGLGDIIGGIIDIGKGLFGGEDDGSTAVPTGGRNFGPCIPPWFRDPVSGQCRFDLDPGPGGGLPGGNGGGFRASGQGLARPQRMSISVDVCPIFADGKKGILWMNALTGEVVCLPRATNGRGWGLIRKNKPRAKPFISAAMKKQLGVSAAATAKAKEFAKLTGQVCESKSARASRNARGK